MKTLSNILVDRTDTGSSDHDLVWFELGKTFGRGRKEVKRCLYKWRVDRQQDKAIRNECQAELGLRAKVVFKL